MYVDPGINANSRKFDKQNKRSPLKLTNLEGINHLVCVIRNLCNELSQISVIIQEKTKCMYKLHGEKNQT